MFSFFQKKKIDTARAVDKDINTIIDNTNWYDVYENLDLLNGEIEFILEDDQDMIEIRYKDGMLIDVGYIEEKKAYYITIVSNEEGWKQPLEEIEIRNKEQLFDRIQDIIYKYRK